MVWTKTPGITGICQQPIKTVLVCSLIKSTQNLFEQWLKWRQFEKTLQYDIAIRLFLGSLQYFNSPLGLWCDVLDTNLEVAISGHKREQIEGKLREINQSVFWSLSRHYPWDTWVLNFMRRAHHYFQVSFCCVCILLLIFFSFFLMKFCTASQWPIGHPVNQK